MHAEWALLNHMKLIWAWMKGAFDWQPALHTKKGTDVNQHVRALRHITLHIAAVSFIGIWFCNTPKSQGQLEQKF